jgi:hypothetical protein
MVNDHRDELRNIRTFPSLVRFLRDEMHWPIESDDFEEITFDYTPEELGIDSSNAAKISEIKRLRQPSAQTRWPWGIFFVKFEPKRLPVVALRRVLGQLVFKKRASANPSDRPAWAPNDLLFVSNYGEGDDRRISFAHFTEDNEMGNLATLKVLGWDGEDTGLHLDDVADKLTHYLGWPGNENDVEAWREKWASAFTLRHREVITTSKALAERLAELARAIRMKVNAALAVETENGKLRKTMKAFQQALIHDLDEDGFADMYAQTIAYGLLSARVSRRSGGLVADDAALMIPVTSPFLRELMETFLKIGGRKRGAGGAPLDFDELGINEVVETLRDANMDAVLRDFGDRNPQEDPVIHFYELFLKEYDPKKRMQRGVYYTPRPVVSYIVSSVDELLRAEFGLEDGLADTTTWGEIAERNNGIEIPEGVDPNQSFVQILDPATGTATFLVGVVDVIYKTMSARWETEGKTAGHRRELWNEYVPKYLLPRLHGYELMMAPYAIAHMKLGLKLTETGFQWPDGFEERARIYLTNSLEPARDFSDTFEFAVPALAHEARAVNEIKRNHCFTVVIGNPPYSGVSANKSAWADQLLEEYYYVDGAPLAERNPKWLQDDYVKFIRLGQEILRRPTFGVFGFITNHGYIDNPTFRGMRRSLLDSFTRLSVLDLHGNTKKKEISPDGSPDTNVFDIQQGVAVLIASAFPGRNRILSQLDLFGTREYKYSVLATTSVGVTQWNPVNAAKPFYVFLCQDDHVRSEYNQFTSIKQIMPVNVLGFQTHRDQFAIAMDKSDIIARCEALRDKRSGDGEIKKRYGLKDGRDWNVREARREISSDNAWKRNVVRCFYRPFDIRWCYFSRVAMDYPRRELIAHVSGRANICLLVPRQISFLPWRHAGVANTVAESCFISTKTKEQNYNFPLFLFPESDGLEFESKRRVNFSVAFLRRLAASISEEPQIEAENVTPEAVLHYIYAILYSPSYRARYAEFLKMDFPRLPIPSGRFLFDALSKLGNRLVSWHLLEANKEESRAKCMSVGGGGLPEIGKISWSDNTVWLDKNKICGFRSVSEDVWNFHIGGYQVCDKWLKDRRGRKLSKDDIEHYQKIVVALHETIRIMKEIDEVIEQHGGWPGAFVQTEIPVAAEPAEEEQPPATSVESAAPAETEAESPPLFRNRAAAVEKKRAREDKKETAEKVDLDGANREELLGVVRQMFSDGVARERDAAIVELARELGYQRTSERVREELNKVLFTAVLRGILENDKNGLALFTRNIEGYNRDFLKEQFLASLRGSRWVERDAAVRGFARWMGFRKAGPVIDKTARSLIIGLLMKGRLERDGDRIRRTT